jgi:hypothetical protein
VPTIGKEAMGDITEEGKKLMHRFSVDEVTSVLEEIAKLRREK